jgi:cytochrome P450
VGEANAILGPVLGRHSVLLLDGARHLRQRRRAADDPDGG